MKKVVVDASIAAKWFIPEVHSDSAARLLDSELVLLAPDLIGAEFGNILWKKLRRAEITKEEAAAILNAFGALPLEIHPSAALLTAAFHIAVSLDRTVYDSLYLALAAAENCVLVTADAKFHDAVRRSVLADHIEWIESPEA